MRPELTELGQEALTHTNDDVVQARAYLVQRLLTDQSLLQAYIKPLVEEMVTEILDWLTRQRRYAMRQGYQATPRLHEVAPHASTVGLTRETPPSPRLRQGLESMARQSWMSYPLMSGRKVLGDMIRPELQKASEWYLAAGKTNLITGQWLTSIAAALKDDETPVKVALKESTLQKLRDRVEKAVA